MYVQCTSASTCTCTCIIVNNGWVMHSSLCTRNFNNEFIIIILVVNY